MPAAPWWRHVDQTLMQQRPTRVPEYVVTESHDRVPAPWLEWHPENYTFKCGLCSAWLTNGDHLHTPAHQSKINWSASKEYRIKIRWAEVDGDFDYSDPWDFQREMGIGKYATPQLLDGQVPAPPPYPPGGRRDADARGPGDASSSNDGRDGDRRGNLQRALEQISDIKADVEELKESVKEIKADVDGLKQSVDEMKVLLNNVIALASGGTPPWQ